MHDDIGNRIKTQYENRSRFYLPRRTYTIVRIDGKAFHTFTRGFKKPFDEELQKMMDLAAIKLCENIQGAELAYVQSDEISILLTDFKKPKTSAYFDGNIQKIASITASMATAFFNEFINFYVEHPFRKSEENKKFITEDGDVKTAFFDSRVFSIPDPCEVENYFIWRQQDATRNSIHMVARSLYSHKECTNKNNSELQEMIWQKEINWNDYHPREKRGGLVSRHKVKKEVTYNGNAQTVERNEWKCEGAPIFTNEERPLRRIIPRRPCEGTTELSTFNQSGEKEEEKV